MTSCCGVPGGVRRGALKQVERLKLCPHINATDLFEVRQESGKYF
jgi:hypothetical protein